MRAFSPPYTGIASSQESYVKVRWGYIAGPIAFMALSLVFFLISLLYQGLSKSKTSAWKTSTLAVLHSLGPEAQREFGGMREPAELGEQGEETWVRLDRDFADGARLVPKRRDAT